MVALCQAKANRRGREDFSDKTNRPSVEAGDQDATDADITHPYLSGDSLAVQPPPDARCSLSFRPASTVPDSCL